MVNITYDASRAIIATDSDTGAQYIYNPGDIAWVLASTPLVMIMTPGVGFFYAGLLRRKNALSCIALSLAVYAVVSLQWYLIGYSLTFSPTASSFIGNFKHFGFIDVLEKPIASIPNATVPPLVFAIYQSMFASLTPMLLLGATAERGRFAPALVFAFVWATLVYDPVACWVWNANGWSARMGALDYAGGGPVHLTSGVGALAYSIWLGKRKGYGTNALAYRPQNIIHVCLGTALLWFGWLGFNGGSALAANFRAASAMTASNLSASIGGLTWMLIDWRLEHKWSAVGFCSGAISGLVTVTPAAGFIAIPSALAFGVVGGALCNYATQLKTLLRFDDSVDIFAVHAVGGFAGNLMTALFADARIMSQDGIIARGGWINRHWMQLPYQLADSCAITGYVFVVTLLILIVMDFIPGLSLRVSENAEEAGIDASEIGELAYDYAHPAKETSLPFGHHNHYASHVLQTLPRAGPMSDKDYPYPPGAHVTTERSTASSTEDGVELHR